MELLDVIKKAIDEKKGEHVIKYDFRSLNPFIDNVILCSAGNIRQVHAIAQNVKERAREYGYPVRSMEGNHDSRWVLVDLDSVVVHVFLDEERKHFQLEKLYADLPCEDFTL